MKIATAYENQSREGHLPACSSLNPLKARCETSTSQQTHGDENSGRHRNFYHPPPTLFLKDTCRRQELNAGVI